MGAGGYGLKKSGLCRLLGRSTGQTVGLVNDVTPLQRKDATKIQNKDVADYRFILHLQVSKVFFGGALKGKSDVPVTTRLGALYQ